MQDFDRSVSMLAICYNSPISKVARNEHLLGKKTTWVKSQIEIAYIQTGGHVFIKSARHVDHFYIYFIGSSTFTSRCCKLRGKLNTTCSVYKNKKRHVVTLIVIWVIMSTHTQQDKDLYLPQAMLCSLNS